MATCSKGASHRSKQLGELGIISKQVSSLPGLRKVASLKAGLQIEQGGQSKLSLLEKQLNAHGLRISPLRAQVWLFFTRHDHVTAKQLHQHIKNSVPGIGLTAVYRTLGQLCKAGVAKTRRYNKQTYYDIAFLRRAPNNLLICTSCGQVLNFVYEKLERINAMVASQHGFQIERYRLEFFGTCKLCRKRESSLKPRPPRPSII
ncbi:MAG: hypothetical protein GDA65_20215 [Nitrospira sp. CR1.1]|nr:hypothetical protein [Nitrospira sp. CR1.1]